MTVALLGLTLCALVGACAPERPAPVLAPVTKAAAPSVDAAVHPLARKHRTFIVAVWRARFGDRSDVAVPFAQIRQESNWKLDALSRVGAQGAAQFMPATAAGLQRSLTELQAICADTRGCPFEFRWAIKAMVALDRDGWAAIPTARTEDDRLRFMLSAYNGGAGNLRREIRTCRERPSRCDPDRWPGHVEATCVRADWACKENREYPKLILDVHRPKYRAWLGGA